MFCKPGSEFDVVMGHLLGQVQGAVVYFVDDVLVETGEGSAPEELLGFLSCDYFVIANILFPSFEPSCGD